MTPSHTPGPWTAYEDNAPGYIDVDAGYQRIASLSIEHARECSPPIPDTEVRANARLIAAAPDLLAALERAVSHMSCRDYTPEDLGCDCDYHAARAALSRARGEGGQS